MRPLNEVRVWQLPFSCKADSFIWWWLSSFMNVGVPVRMLHSCNISHRFLAEGSYKGTTGLVLISSAPPLPQHGLCTTQASPKHKIRFYSPRDTSAAGAPWHTVPRTGHGLLIWEHPGLFCPRKEQIGQCKPRDLGWHLQS